MHSETDSVWDATQAGIFHALLKIKMQKSHDKSNPYNLIIWLKTNDQEIPHEENPTYLGIRFDRRMTWKPHIQEMEKRATRRFSLMKKLSGTKWGANRKIFQQVYTGYVRPVMEYGSAAWATAAKSNTSRLTKVHNTGMRLITEGMKSTPINALETATQLQPLDQRREEKVSPNMKNSRASLNIQFTTCYRSHANRD